MVEIDDTFYVNVASRHLGLGVQSSSNRKGEKLERHYIRFTIHESSWVGSRSVPQMMKCSELHSAKLERGVLHHHMT